ncbi:CBS domain-containing protein [Chloroflexota bacterium]
MLVKDIMTKPVMTTPSNTTIGEAKKLMKEHKYNRLPVVDDGKLVGLVTRGRVEQYLPQSPAPQLWKVNHLIQQTALEEIMERNVVTVSPGTLVEQAVFLAQSRRVGALIVVENQKVVGIATTNDFFYKVVNPILGIGMKGIRITVSPAYDNKHIASIVNVIAGSDIIINALWIINTETDRKEIVVHLDTDDATGIIKELEDAGFTAVIRPHLLIGT